MTESNTPKNRLWLFRDGKYELVGYETAVLSVDGEMFWECTTALLDYDVVIDIPHTHKDRSIGIEDCKGVEIYESDEINIVNRGKFTWQGKRPDPEKYIVNFRSGCFMADHERNGKNDTDSMDVVLVWHTLMEAQMLIEVIGNTRTSKLLEVK